jgi:hypothetical protein
MKSKAKKAIPNRLTMVRRVRQGLERHAWPRLQMFLIVALTGAAGFLASWSMLQAGFDTMWLRYAAAMCAAYAVFLMLLWLWIRTSAADYAEVMDITGLVPDSTGTHHCYAGGGGSFDGGGASGNFAIDGGGDTMLGDMPKGLGDTLGAAGDADELAIPLAVLLLAAGLVVVLLVSCFSVIWSAPLLLAELMVDGALSVGLFQKLRGIDARHWLDTALKRTFKPFLATTVLVAACGWGLGLYAPGAHTLGEVLAQSKQLKP